MRLFDHLVMVRSPLTESTLAMIDGSVQVVQFQERLSDAEHKALATVLEARPEVRLRVFGSEITDLDFLRFYPSLQGFIANHLYNSLGNIDGLGYLPTDLRYLSFGQTRRRLSLAPLARFRSLRRLVLEGQTKDIEVISGLRELRSLTLRSITFTDLALLLPLSQLRALDLKLGGTRDLSALPDIGRLEYLEIWMVKGLSDLSAVASLPALEFPFLQSLSQVRHLPPMTELVALRRVHLETMKGLVSLEALASAPNLRQLAVWGSPQLQPEDFAPLVGHPTLASLEAHLGSKRKNEALRKLLPLDRAGDWEQPFDY